MSMFLRALSRFAHSEPTGLCLLRWLPRSKINFRHLVSHILSTVVTSRPNDKGCFPVVVISALVVLAVASHGMLPDDITGDCTCWRHSRQHGRCLESMDDGICMIRYALLSLLRRDSTSISQLMKDTRACNCEEKAGK